ncbi:MAG: copper transporter [Clostridia bacterium]|jgi:hypothetical protein
MMHHRYYIILLIGIFLSLGIGISIGISLEERDFIEKQQKTLTQQIIKNMESLKKENQALQIENQILVKNEEQYKSMNESLFVKVASNSLRGMRIAVIDTSGDDVLRELKDFIQITKAEISGYITLNDQNWMEVQTTAAGLDIVSNKETVPVSQFGRSVVETLYTGLPSDYFNLLNSNRIIQSRISVQSPADLLILVDKWTSDEETDIQINHAIIREATSNGIPILYVSFQEIHPSFRKLLREQKTQVCEKIDTLQGKLDLLTLLTDYRGTMRENQEAED